VDLQDGASFMAWDFCSAWSLWPVASSRSSHSRIQRGPRNPTTAIRSGGLNQPVGESSDWLFSPPLVCRAPSFFAPSSVARDCRRFESRRPLAVLLMRPLLKTAKFGARRT
jgi:hypothetical protein